jgi:heptosyltransferase-1
MRILIVKMSAMGDILHALPVIPFLQEIHPDIEIDWVVEEAFAGLLTYHPAISQLQIIRLKSWKKALFAAETWREIRALVARLRSRRYDLVLDIQGNIKSGMVAWLSGCPVRVGFDRRVTQEALNTLFTSHQMPVLPEDRHVTDQYLRLVSGWFGRELPQIALDTDIVAAPDDQLWAESLLQQMPQGRLVLLQMGTTWQTKFWYEAGWIALSRLLMQRYPDVVPLLTWGNEAEHIAAERVAQTIGGRVQVLDRVSLVRLSALIKRVALVIGGDTGVVHLAAAVGTPTVSYYRSSDGARSGPRGERHVVIQAPVPCTRCFKTTCDTDQLCRESITPDMLMAAVERILE